MPQAHSTGVAWHVMSLQAWSRVSSTDDRWGMRDNQMALTKQLGHSLPFKFGAFWVNCRQCTNIHHEFDHEERSSWTESRPVRRRARGIVPGDHHNISQESKATMYYSTQAHLKRTVIRHTHPFSSGTGGLFMVIDCCPAS